MSGFFKLTTQNNELPDFYYGYPVEAFSWIDKEDSSLRTFLTPAVIQPVVITAGSGRLKFEMSGAPRLNERWLEGHFYRESKEAVLTAVRSVGHQGVTTLSRIVEVLAPFLNAKKTIEPPNPFQVRPLPTSFENERNGLRNSAILLASKKLKYNRGLLAELRWIRDHATEEQLEQTSLQYLFKFRSDDAISTETRSAEKKVKGSVQFEKSIQYRHSALNSEQRAAVDCASGEPLSLILGPPGTGKTDVGAAIAIQEYLNGRSVLFCSRNHVAVREFAGRCNGIPGCPPIVVQPGEDGHPSTFAEAVMAVLSMMAPETLEHNVPSPELQRLQVDAGRASARLAELETAFAVQRDCHTRSASAWARIHRLIHEVPLSQRGWLESSAFPSELGERISPRGKLAQELLAQLVSKGLRRRFLAVVRSTLFALTARADCKSFAALSELGAVPSVTKIKESLQWVQRAAISCDVGLASAEIRTCEAILAAGPTTDVLAQAWKEDEGRLIEVTRSILPEYFNTRIQRIPAAALRELIELQPVLRSSDGRGLSDKMKVAISRKVHSSLPTCLKVLPLWAVTNLSLRRCVPIASGAFDLAVIDEASQCDIASAIPVMYRARRVAVIGDRFQLSHTTRIPAERDGVIFGETALEDVSALAYRYAANSLYDLADSRLNRHQLGRRVMLREHYRCHDEIINFCSETFYPRPLRVRTDVARLHVPSGRSAGLHWTHLASGIERGTEGGCRSPGEAAACVSEVTALIRERGFSGSIGIVTPFRAQKILLRQLLEQELTSAEIARCPIIADTAHGFQGGQRDVVIMSLVLGPDMPDGSRHFISEGRNLFNVAVSRAAAVLHVIGNLEYASQCGIAHITKFAQYYLAKQSRQHLQSKPPVPDRWENRLKELLESAGISTIPQHSVDNRFLDLAYIDRGFKLDIEVDGVASHMTEAGDRVDDDVWRDLKMKALGWEVLRFWVCQVRDQPERCVAKVKSLIESKQQKR